MSKPSEVIILWVVADIKEVRPDWSDERCEEFLNYYEEDIQEVCIQAGWEIINSLVDNEDE
jgi:hypothetical protein